MAAVTDRDAERSLTERDEIQAFLARYGIWYRRFEGYPLGPDATDEELLAVHAKTIEELKAQGGYRTVDVVNVHPQTPDLDRMMQKFATEHTHSEDEVRLVVSGRGLFHIHPENEPVFSIEVAAGDMINIPADTRHWFHLCENRAIRAIRLFQDPSGWVPEYTNSRIEASYKPLCFGPPPVAGPDDS